MKQQRQILALPVLWMKYNPVIVTDKVRQQPTKNDSPTIRNAISDCSIFYLSSTAAHNNTRNDIH